MQPDALRFIFARLRPVLSDLVLAGLLLAALAALVLAGPVIAGEVGADFPPVLWQRLPADGRQAGFRPYPVEFRGLTGLDLALRETADGASWRGFFFSAGDGLRIGAQGSFNPGSGNLRAIVALKLEF